MQSFFAALCAFAGAVIVAPAAAQVSYAMPVLPGDPVVIGNQEADQTLRLYLIATGVNGEGADIFRVMTHDPSSTEDLVDTWVMPVLDGRVRVEFHPLYLTRQDLWAELFARCSDDYVATLRALFEHQDLWWDHVDPETRNRVEVTLSEAAEGMRSILVPKFLTAEEHAACSRDATAAGRLMQGFQLIRREPGAFTNTAILGDRVARGWTEIVIMMREEFE